MDVLDLMRRLNGEVLANKARAKYKDKIVILGRMNGNEWEATDQGRAIAAELNTKQSAFDATRPAEVADVPTLVKPKRRPKAKPEARQEV